MQYQHLTDGDIKEGDEKDVVTIKKMDEEDTEVVKMLALGNRALFDIEQPPIPAKYALYCINVNVLESLLVVVMYRSLPSA